MMMFVVVAADEILDYDDEFLKGMEAGFFIRNEVDGHKSYNCPESVVSKEE